MEKKCMIYAGLLVLSCSILVHGFLAIPKQNRYEIIKMTDVNIAIIDHEKDEIYYKFISPNEGPTNWELLELPE